MMKRLLLAIDQSENRQAAVDFTIGLGASSEVEVQVLHVRELSTSLRVPPLETSSEAELLVQETVDRLQAAGIAAEGEACSARETQVARRIVDVATRRMCDAIILGSVRLRGFQSLMGHGVRERVLKLSSLPVIVTAPSLRVDIRSMADL
jgi:nucleotide-binding universal stress UspA family protein